MFAWILGLSLVSLFLIFSYNKCINLIHRKDEEIIRLNNDLSDIRSKIHLIEKNKTSETRTNHLFDQLKEKAGKNEFETVQRTVKELENKVFADESLDDSLKRSERIHLD